MACAVIDLRDRVSALIPQDSFTKGYLNLLDPTFLALKKTKKDFSVVVRLRLDYDKDEFVVLKLVRIYGDRWEPSSYQEICLILQLQKFIFSGLCPHFPLLFTCQQGKAGEIVPALLRSKYETEHVAGVVVEYARLGSMWNHIIKIAETWESADILRSVIFQVIYATAFLQRWFPGFRHNDLHTLNVLLTSSDDKTWEYTLPSGKRYWIPMFVRVILWDFELSWSPEFSNKHISTSMDQEAGIQAVPSQKYDLHFFLNSTLCLLQLGHRHCVRNKGYQRIANRINTILGGSKFVGKDESPFIRNFRLKSEWVLVEDSALKDLPTPLELLESDEELFRPFRRRPRKKADKMCSFNV